MLVSTLSRRVDGGEGLERMLSCLRGVDILGRVWIC